MNEMKRLYLRLRYRNLVGLLFYVWFLEDGREYRVQHIVRSQYKKDKYWTSQVGVNNYAGHSGDWIRQCLTEKVLIEM